MISSARRRVLIRTRPLGQGNYGGILQAYALQQVLIAAGAAPITDLSPGVAVGEAPTSGLGRMRAAIKRLAVSLDLPWLSRPSWVADALRAERDASLRRFVREHIRTTKLYSSRGNVDPETLADLDAFVVGSDQVWRAAYGRIPTYLFDFLPAQDQRPRIAYAASFGVGTLAEFDSALLEVTRTFAQRMDAISVRELSAIALCREAWGVDASHALDPTLLLPRTHYEAIASCDAAAPPSGSLITYILDTSPDIEQQINCISGQLGLIPHGLLPSDPPTRRIYRRFPERYSRPGVEEWLGAIAGARLVVTDSFHGTVFSIIFGVPFITIINDARGAARFESLLHSTGLESRLITPTSAIPSSLLVDSIDWAEVERRISVDRNQSLAFLCGALGMSLPLTSALAVPSGFD